MPLLIRVEIWFNYLFPYLSYLQYMLHLKDSYNYANNSHILGRTAVHPVQDVFLNCSCSWSP